MYAVSLSLLLAEASLWIILSCNNLTLEKFPGFSFLGPFIHNRNACNEIGNQAEYFVYQTPDPEQLLVVFL